jgi:hypothetical protein
MTKRPLKDIGTSVRARLLRIAHERGEDFRCCSRATQTSGCSSGWRRRTTHPDSC